VTPQLRSWQHPFFDANALLLPGRHPALGDTGFVGHTDETVAWARTHAGNVDLVVNTHWHSNHVGGNGSLQGCSGLHLKRRYHHTCCTC